MHFKEIDENSLGLVMEDDKFAVYADKLDRTIFCVGYRVVQKDLEGTLDAEALKAAGVPFGPLLDKLRMDKMWFLKMERKSLPKTLFPHLRKVKVITILGDTRKTNASVRLGLGADVPWSTSLLMVRGDEKLPRAMVIQRICKQPK